MTKHPEILISREKREKNFTVGREGVAQFTSPSNIITFFWPMKYFTEEMIIDVLCHEINHWAHLHCTSMDYPSVFSCLAGKTEPIRLLERAADWGRVYASKRQIIVNTCSLESSIRYQRKRVVRH